MEDFVINSKEVSSVRFAQQLNDKLLCNMYRKQY